MTAADLRAWRERMNWTQPQAACQLGMSARQYKALELGDSPIRRKFDLAAIALEKHPRLRLPS